MSAPATSIRVSDVSPYTPPRCPCGLMMRHKIRRGWVCRVCGPFLERPAPMPVDLDRVAGVTS